MAATPFSLSHGMTLVFSPNSKLSMTELLIHGVRIVGARFQQLVSSDWVVLVQRADLG
jgi:hypothetical protein